MSGSGRNVLHLPTVGRDAELARERQVTRALEPVGHGIIGLDSRGRCIFANAAALDLLELPPSRLIGRSFADLVQHSRDSGENLEGHASPINRCIARGESYCSRGRERFTQGERSFLVDLSVSPLISPNFADGVIMAFHDVTAAWTRAQHLEFQALHDPLTDLVNRRGFELRLDELLSSAREGREHALCFLDLDRFKQVNDRCGHGAGDEVLCHLASALRRHVREGDMLARLGGDEFGVLLQDCSLDAASLIAQGLRDVIGDFRFAAKGQEFTLGASIGVAPIRGDSGAAVLAAADAACYAAKSRGTNLVQLATG